jgi:hypothetical protein
VVQSHLSAFAIKGSPNDDEDTLSALVTSQLEQLRELALDFTQRQIDSESRLEEAYQKRESNLERRTKSEEERLAKQASDNEKRLRSEKQKIEDWRKEINDREPQHERRRLREHLTKQLQESIAKPDSDRLKDVRTSHLYYLYFGIFFVLISVVLIAVSQIYPSTTVSAFWSNSVKSLAAGIAGAAFIWAGLSSYKTAALSNRKHEQALEKYAFDMDRASWVVETILQMNFVEKTAVPEQWLESVCTDLFSTSVAEKHKTEPIEALAALLDATAHARFGTNGVEFEINRRGAKKLAAQD